MNLIFIGPPGAGKGTQCENIVRDFGVVQLSTGDMLRSNIKMGTALGKEADRFISKGNLVPDEVIINIIKNELKKSKVNNGYILDGFPRTLPQAKALDELLKGSEKQIDAVLVLEVPIPELVKRLTARRTCKLCGKTYHMEFKPPKNFDRCNDPCGGELYQRDDDTEETVLKRLDIYKNMTKPLINFYQKRELAEKINGVGALDSVYDRIKHVLEKNK